MTDQPRASGAGPSGELSAAGLTVGTAPPAPSLLHGPMTTRLITAQLITLVSIAQAVIVVIKLVGSQGLHSGIPGPLIGTGPVAQTLQRNPHLALFLLLGIPVLAIMGTTLYGVAIARRLRRSLSDLTMAAEQVTGGDYDVQVAVPHNESELIALTSAFNDMAEQLRTTETTRRTMLTDLAHEMRTPISSLDVTIEALRDGVFEVNEAVLDTMRAQTSRLTRLSTDIREVSAAEEGRLALTTHQLDLRELVTSCQHTFSDAGTREGVDLEVTPLPSVPVVAAVDEDRAAQVVNNLLTNAFRHTQPGGVVQLSLATADGVALISVTDHGDGIAPEHLGRIFERFYRVGGARDTKHGGTGVGLAISRAIARAHHGSLEVTSEGLGKGSTFTFSLPLHGESASSG